MGMTDAEAADVLDHMFIGPYCYISLHGLDPQPIGDISTEIVKSNNGYRRKRTLMQSSGARSVSNIRRLIWTGLPKIRVTHVGVWTFESDLVWKMLTYGALPTPLTPGDNGGIVIEPGTLEVTLT